MSVVSDAQKRLRQAGVAEDMVTLLVANDSGAQFIMDMSTAQLDAIALNNPAGGVSAYAEAQSTYGFTGEEFGARFPARPSGLPATGRPTSDMLNLMGPPQGGKPYVESEGGAIMFRNGVIANPQTGEVFFPNDKAAPGSAAWLGEAQEKWSQAKINNWREKLLKFGYGEKYELAKKGGFDQQFLAALSEYHTSRYLNFGKAVPLTNAGAEPGEKISDVITRPEVRNEVRSWFREGFGDDPSDAEMQWAVKGFFRLAKKGLLKGKTAERAAGIAGAKVQEKFFESPQVKYLGDIEEENTSLRDSMIQLGQSIEGL